MFNKLFTYIKQRHRLPVVSLLCLILIYASAQAALSPNVNNWQAPQKPLTAPAPTKQGKPKVVEIKFAKFFLNRDSLPGITILKDSVILYHDGAFLYCDSAYFNEKLNTFDAFDNVRMEQGDTIILRGNYMYYDGNTKLVRFRENVSLEHYPKSKKNVTTLFTDSLNYDRVMNIGYYFDGGALIDSLNELTSFWGQYEPSLNLATFKDSVTLTNPKFTLYSDLLKYNTADKRAIISTPTTIVSDSGTIHTSKGWYNTDTEESLLLDQSSILNKEGNRILRGDSILYNKAKGYGEVYGNMFLQDTLKKIILMGEYGFYDELTDYAIATDSALCIEYSQSDSLFLHGDTLKLISIIDTIKYQKKEIKALPADSAEINDIEQLEEDNSFAEDLETDSLSILPPQIVFKEEEKDSIQNLKIIKAYHNVRFFRNDIQGICDSLQFSTKDSVIHMYKNPVLWNTNRQLTGDTIDVFMNDSTIDYMHVKNNAFSIEQKDSIHYNQLKSNSLKIFFNNKKVRQVLAEGGVETITYPEEKNGEMIGLLNVLTTSYLRIDFVEGKFSRLLGWSKSVGSSIPFHLVKPEELRLNNFFWLDYLRPLDKKDVFRKIGRKTEDIKEKSSVFNREE